MRCMLPTLLAYWPLLASAQSAALADAPGPTPTPACGAFVVGPCVTRPARAPASSDGRTPPAVAPPATARPRNASEAEVDAFIASHGKPSREVARAMLDPTDENVAAMMRRLQRDQAIAAYVGQRMTELQQSDPTLATPPAAVPGDLPSFTGVRLLLVTQFDCARCDRAAQALQRLVAIYPTVDARIAIAGAREPQQIVQEMARTGVTLPTVAAEPALLQRIRLLPPYLLVADLRRQREGVIVAVEDTDRLRLAVLEFQRAGAAQAAARANAAARAEQGDAPAPIDRPNLARPSLSEAP